MYVHALVCWYLDKLIAKFKCYVCNSLCNVCLWVKYYIINSHFLSGQN